MENTITKKSKSLKCGFVIKPLSIIALVCAVLNFITTTIKFGFIWIDMLYFILTLTPFVLLMLYIFKFHSKLKATVLVPIIFGLFGLNTIFNLNGILYREYFLPFGTYRILGLAILVCSILAVISALKGFNKKAFIIISMSVCLLHETLFLLEMLASMKYHIMLSLYISPLGSIGTILLYISLLLFVLKNKIPSVISKEKARAKKMSPEQELKLLKDKLARDMITEEEYQAQRAEIISKL